MKKALQGSNEVFIYERHGTPHVWAGFAEDIIESANQGITGVPQGDLVCQQLREWLRRYLEEGITERFLNDLNTALHTIRYAKYILPVDLLPSDHGFPQNAYVAQYDTMPTPEAYAADDFSKLLTSGQLRRLKRCEWDGCRHFFLGPPQARWCSKACGSKFRVQQKRKRDAAR